MVSLSPAKFSLRITITLATLLFVMPCSAQSDDYEPDKNPFGQPDILKYRAPVRAPKNNAVKVDKNNVPELKLTATLISVSQPMVIVNDRLLHVGEEIEGMKLKIIDEARAVFQFRGKLHVFTIEDANNTQTR